MKYITLFETFTRAKVKDAVENQQTLIFIVQEGEMGKAIGKGGATIKRLENTLKRKIKIVEFSDDVKEFIRHYIFPLKVNEIAQEEETITITGPDTKTKGLLIGRDSKNLNQLLYMVKRYFKISSIKVV